MNLQYSMSLEQMLREGGYAELRGYIPKIWVQGEGKVSIPEVIELRQDTDGMEAVLKQVAERGYRVANIPQLLALGMSRPHEIATTPVAVFQPFYDEVPVGSDHRLMHAYRVYEIFLDTNKRKRFKLMQHKYQKNIPSGADIETVFCPKKGTRIAVMRK